MLENLKIFLGRYFKASKAVRLSAAFLIVVFCLGDGLQVKADSLSDLNKLKQQLSQQVEDAKKQAQAKQTQADALKNQINKVSTQINQTESSINSLSSQISQTGKDIADLDGKIQDQMDKLATEKAKMSTLVSSWYMERQDGLLVTLLDTNNISEMVDREQSYNSTYQQLETISDNISKAKDDLNNKRNEKANQMSALDGLKSDQEAQKSNLEANKQIKNRLLNDTNGAITDLNQKQQQAQERIKAVDAQIRALTATRIWGGQIVSSNDGGWYFTQTGNYTHLGNSPYTVSQYGCLITSMAMVATYYGHNVSPSDIASNTALFDDNGYLQVNSPPGIGVNILPSRTVDWNVVDDEVSNDRPVIVSIYLPSVGAVNRDGSSHFIVIKGKSNGKYLMHDPIGDGRGYNMSQVRSMKLVRPY
jgi:peptidoglycan hydrolase CwlO-like protein